MSEQASTIKDKLGSTFYGNSTWCMLQSFKMSLITLRFKEMEQETKYRMANQMKIVKNMRFFAFATVLAMSFEFIQFIRLFPFEIFMKTAVMRSVAIAITLMLACSTFLKHSKIRFTWNFMYLLALYVAGTLVSLSPNFLYYYFVGDAKIHVSSSWMIYLFSLQSGNFLYFVESALLSVSLLATQLIFYAALIPNCWQREFGTVISNYVAIVIAALLASYTRELYGRRKFISLESRDLSRVKDVEFTNSLPELIRNSSKDIAEYQKRQISSKPSSLRQIITELDDDKSEKISRYASIRNTISIYHHKINKLLFLEYDDPKQEALYKEYYGKKAITRSTFQSFAQTITDISIVLLNTGKSPELDKYIIARLAVPISLFVLSLLLCLIPQVRKRPRLIQMRNVLIVYMFSSGYVFQITSSSDAGNVSMFYIICAQYVSYHLNTSGMFNIRIKYLFVLSLCCIVTMLTCQLLVLENVNTIFLKAVILAHFVAYVGSYFFERDVRAALSLKLKRDALKKTALIV